MRLVGLQVGEVDGQADQVRGLPTRRGQRGEQVDEGLLELRHHAGHDLPVPAQADLAGQEHQAAFGHGHRVREAGWPAQFLGIDPLHAHAQKPSAPGLGDGVYRVILTVVEVAA
jgi:hypothetical protein